MPAGYSGTPLARKLGIKQGHSVLAVGAPPGYEDLLEGLPEEVALTVSGAVPDAKPSGDPEGPAYDIIHIFTKEEEVLASALPVLKERIVPNGAIWASWPKKASKVPTDVTGNVVRDLGLRNGLVDVKVCAVDEVWSGLKFVIPVEHRPKA